MSFLLLPGDERVLVERLVEDFELQLLADDLAPGGEPRVVPHPLEALPDDLPLPARPGQPPSAPGTLVFWAEELGPIRTLGDAPPSDDPRDRVASLLTREATSTWRDLIDITRTPVIRFHRSHWHDEDRKVLQPGLLQGMELKATEQPVAVARLRGRIDRWMKQCGIAINPFDHAPDLPVEQPKNVKPFLAWAWPEAEAWIRGGGRVWPWTG